MTEKIIGASPRCGKSIKSHICPDCHTQLTQINETLFYCPICEKKIKAGVLSIPTEPDVSIKMEAPRITGHFKSTVDKRAENLQAWFKKKVNERVYNGRGRQ